MFAICVNNQGLTKHHQTPCASLTVVVTTVFVIHRPCKTRALLQPSSAGGWQENPVYDLALLALPALSLIVACLDRDYSRSGSVA